MIFIVLFILMAFAAWVASEIGNEPIDKK